MKCGRRKGQELKLGKSHANLISTLRVAGNQWKQGNFTIPFVVLEYSHHSVENESEWMAGTRTDLG